MQHQHYCNNTNTFPRLLSSPHPPPSLPSSLTPPLSVSLSPLSFSACRYSNLNPLDKGDFSGMEMDEIKEGDPVWYQKLSDDPYQTRFPGGESYQVSRTEGRRKQEGNCASVPRRFLLCEGAFFFAETLRALTCFSSFLMFLFFS